MLADGTRQFRYNYKNQLRKVWRKSDGDTTGTGRVAEYREDAFARRVHAQSWWELGRHTYLDTRFELDVAVDAEGDTAEMVLIDGGMHGTLDAIFAANLQEASWPSLIDRPTGDNESHYFDFLIDVPNISGGNDYLGYVAYHNYQVRVFGNRYELWQSGGVLPIATHFAGFGTQGRHNLGIRAGNNSGVWLNGTQIINSGIPLATKPTVGFGSKAWDNPLTNPVDYIPGLTLFENLTYTRAFNRTEFSPSNPADAPGTLAPGMPRVTTTHFDGPVDITNLEVRDNAGVASVAPAMDQNGDATSRDQITADGPDTQIYLPNGRRTTAHVIENGADGTVATGDGTVVTAPGGLTTVGVRYTLLTDAVGATRNYITANPLGSHIPSSFTNNPNGEMPQTGLSFMAGVTVYHGGAGEPAGPGAGAQSALAMGAASGGGSPAQMQQYFQADDVVCAC